MDWSDCPDVESIPGKASGQWVVKGTRILADGVIVNADSGITPEELEAEIFPGVGVERARRIIAYAKSRRVPQLLDENVPAALRHLLQGHKARTSRQMGWAGMSNGDLIAAAEVEA